MRGRAGIGEIIAGVSIVVTPLAVYSTYVNSIPILDVPTTQQLEYLAYSVILLTMMGISSGYSGRRFLGSFQRDDHKVMKVDCDRLRT